MKKKKGILVGGGPINYRFSAGNWLRSMIY